MNKSAAMGFILLTSLTVLGGGQGECQLSGGRTINATFGPS